MKLHVTLSAALVCLFASAASAQPGAPVEIKKERKHSINASPLGLLSGSYNVNYEHLSGSHGFLGELTLQNFDNDDASSSGGGATIGYRWHWRGQQNSGFLGVNLGMWAGTGEGTVTTNNEQKTFDVDTRVVAVTGNIGKRWAWDNGLNITLRIGAGYGNYAITTESDDPDAQLAVDLVDELLTFIPVAVDGELSLGYTF